MSTPTKCFPPKASNWQKQQNCLWCKCGRTVSTQGKRQALHFCLLHELYYRERTSASQRKRIQNHWIDYVALSFNNFSVSLRPSPYRQPLQLACLDWSGSHTILSSYSAIMK